MKINLSINREERKKVEELLQEKDATRTTLSLSNLLSKIVKACERAEHQSTPRELNTLKSMTWYIAEVSFRSSNPIHRAIAFHRSGGYVELYGSYERDEMPMGQNVNQLAYFRPVQELKGMGEDSGYFMPKDAPKIIYIER